MSVVFFTDRDLGRQFPAVLVEAGLSVERHADVFPDSAPDETWLEYVGGRGRVAITHDGRIRYKPNELSAVMRHRVALLVVIGKRPYPELARHFVATMPKILAFLERHSAPFIAKVHQPSSAAARANADSPGSIVLWHPK